MERRPYRTVEQETAIRILLLSIDTPPELKPRKGQEYPVPDDELIEEIKRTALNTLLFENMIFPKLSDEEKQSRFKRYFRWRCPDHPGAEPIVKKGRFRFGDTGRKKCTKCSQSSVEVSLRLASKTRSSRQLQTVFEGMGLL